MIDIGDKIKRTRLKLGLTQEELAARTELSKGFISQLERNLTSPSIATLIDILEALGTDIADFFTTGDADEKSCLHPGRHVRKRRFRPWLKGLLACSERSEK